MILQSWNKWHRWTILSAVAFASLSAAHLIDDFVAGVPGEFNLSVPVTEMLSLAFMTALVGLVASASMGSRKGYLGLTIGGVLIMLTQLSKSLPEILRSGPWRTGLVSEALAIGLAVAASLTAVTAYMAFRGTHRE